MTGGYLAIQVQQLVIPPIAAFRKYIFGELLPHFGDLDSKADRLANKYFEDEISRPADDDFDGDLSGFAEDAQDYGVGWYLMMRSLRQTMLNLLAAGLFHLTEQQLAQLGRDAGFQNREPKDTKLDEIVSWYESTFALKLRDLPNWSVIDELRLVANSAKHAEGKSSEKLRTIRPELFYDQEFAKRSEALGDDFHEPKERIFAPLAGEDLFVTEEFLKQYADGVEAFCEEIMAYFDTHDKNHY
jgi:hypothetical protein